MKYNIFNNLNLFSVSVSITENIVTKKKYGPVRRLEKKITKGNTI